MFESFEELELFADSDGVVVDFNAYVLKHYGKSVDGLQGKEKGMFWGWVTHHDKNVEKFFRNMPKMEDADILMDFIFAAKPKSFSILTARGNTPSDGEQQKKDWYAENYPGVNCIVVRKSPDKAQYAHPKAVLIDDRAKSIDPWVEAGGIGILHVSAEDTIRQLRELIIKE